jgi:hypothetical protein
MSMTAGDPRERVAGACWLARAIDGRPGTTTSTMMMFAADVLSSKQQQMGQMMRLQTTPQMRWAVHQFAVDRASR